MAQKKKTSQATTNKTVTKKEDAATTNLTYEGTVTISVKKGNRVISKRVIKNSGSDKMFSFITNCLKGIFNPSLRPARICLFGKNTNVNRDNAEDSATWDFAAKSNLQVSQRIMQSSAIVTEDVSEETKRTRFYTVYEFQIPYSYITGDIYKLALFPRDDTAIDGYSNTSSDESDANKPDAEYTYDPTFGKKYLSAYIGLITGETGSKNWDPIKLSGNDSNFMLAIQWKIEIATA